MDPRAASDGGRRPAALIGAGLIHDADPRLLLQHVAVLFIAFWVLLAIGGGLVAAMLSDPAALASAEGAGKAAAARRAAAAKRTAKKAQQTRRAMRRTK